MRCCRLVRAVVLAIVVAANFTSAASRISNLPVTSRRHHATQQRCLWGIRGGSDEDQDDESNGTRKEEVEDATILTTEEEEASSDAQEIATVSNDTETAVEQASVVQEEEETPELIPEGTEEESSTSFSEADAESETTKDETEESNDESSEPTQEEATASTAEADEEELENYSDREEEEPPLPLVDEEAMMLARDEAQELRQGGKDLHDEGNWQEAATQFHQASLLLESFVAEQEEILQEYATCRLHEALCRLKVHDYEQSVEACTAVLEREPQAAIRARALHRRSRAKLGLGLEEEALLDARQAAFLGDRKAVALYGKLMRQDSAGSENSSLQDLLQGGGSNPFLSGDAPSSPSSSALLESLLNKSGDSGSANPFAGAGPMGMFLNNGNNKSGGLAKSVLSSLSKTVENESTQENICRYLQNTNVGQVQQMAQMAGVPLSESHATRLVDFCHGITPKGIRKSVKTTKRIWYGVSLLRKISQIISKYRFVFILWALSVWIKSAIRRPIPINKRAARLAIKEALKQGTV